MALPSNGTARPIPDPTTLTDELVRRSVEALKEITEVHFQALNDRLTASIAMNDRHADLAVAHNTEVMSEKIKALTDSVATFKDMVKDRFQIADKQTETAFAAAKEAVLEQNKSNALSITKSETATEKRIDQLIESQQLATGNTNSNIESLKKAVDDKNNDLKDRVGLIEGRSSGVGQTGVIIVGAFAILASLAAIIDLVVHFVK